MAGELPLSNNAEGGTNGTTVSAANSGGASGNAFDSIFIDVGDSLVFDSGRKLHGGLTYKGNNIANAIQMRWNPASAFTTIYGRAYLCQAVVQRWDWIDFENSSDQLNAVIRIDDTGHIACESFDGLTSASTGVTTGTTVISALTWYRIEWQMTISATVGVVEADLFAGDSKKLIERISRTGANTGAGTGTYFRFGNRTTVAANDWWFDDLQANLTGKPGPSERYIESLDHDYSMNPKLRRQRRALVLV